MGWTLDTIRVVRDEVRFLMSGDELRMCVSVLLVF